MSSLKFLGDDDKRSPIKVNGFLTKHLMNNPYFCLKIICHAFKFLAIANTFGGNLLSVK